MIILILFGFLCGVIANILGLGSSLMLAPLLLYVYPLLTGEFLDIQTVISATLALTFFSCTAGSIRYHGLKLIPYRYALLLGSIGALGSFIGGSYVSQFTNHLSILILFGVMATLSFIFNLFPNSDLAEKPVQRQYFILGFMLIFILGVLTGIVGIGGMAVFIPYMLRVLRFPIRKTIGATTFAGAMIALFGILGKANIGEMDLQVGLTIAIGGMLGGYIGPSLARYFPDRVLRWGMNIILLCIILTIIFDISKLLAS